MLNGINAIMRQLPPLSNIQHPIEGCFYLLVIAVIFRSIWPTKWNQFLKRISAEDQDNPSQNELS